MSAPCMVLIAAPDLMPKLKEKVGPAEGELLTFSDTDALRALDAILKRKPEVVALERLFSATPRGGALINRIKADPSLTHAEIRVVAQDGTQTILSAPQGAAAPAAGAAPQAAQAAAAAKSAAPMASPARPATPAAKPAAAPPARPAAAAVPEPPKPAARPEAAAKAPPAPAAPPPSTAAATSDLWSASQPRRVDLPAPAAVAPVPPPAATMAPPTPVQITAAPTPVQAAPVPAPVAAAPAPTPIAPAARVEPAAPPSPPPAPAVDPVSRVNPVKDDEIDDAVELSLGPARPAGTEDNNLDAFALADLAADIDAIELGEAEPLVDFPMEEPPEPEPVAPPSPPAAPEPFPIVTNSGEVVSLDGALDTAVESEPAPPRPAAPAAAVPAMPPSAMAAAPAAPAPAPAAAGAPAPALDQKGTRRAPRFKMADTAGLVLDGAAATLVDLSTVGAQVLSKGALKPNQRVGLALTDKQGSIKLRGSVAWALFEIPPRYRAGIDFTDPDATALDAFISRHKEP